MKTSSLSLLLIFICHTSSLSQSSSIIAPGAELIQVDSSFIFTEGPVADKFGDVYFTDQPNNRILKWSKGKPITVFMENAGRANGLYFDEDQNLLAAADEANELWKINAAKKVSVLVDSYQDKKLNGPNDIWVDSFGGIYFTDPYYQRPYWTHTEPEITDQRVYYLSKEGELSIAADDLVKPNGIIGTADNSMIYVADIGDNKTYSYTISGQGKLTNRKLLTEMGSDGMTLDELGNIYLTGNGVSVFDPEGNQIEQIDVPKAWTANVTFGGPDNKTLFITAMNSVYTLDMNVKGAH